MSCISYFFKCDSCGIRDGTVEEMEDNLYLCDVCCALWYAAHQYEPDYNDEIIGD